jgi:hypothetical protein
VPQIHRLFLIVNDKDKSPVFQSLSAFPCVVSRPLRCIFAGGVGIIVVIGEIECPTQLYGNQGVIGLKSTPVFMDKVILICNGTPRTGTIEVGYPANVSQFREEFGLLDSSFHSQRIRG